MSESLRVLENKYDAFSMYAIVARQTPSERRTNGQTDNETRTCTNNVSAIAGVTPRRHRCHSSTVSRHKRTDRRRKSNLVHFTFKMRHLVAMILMIFLIINWPNFYEASRFVPHMMDAPDRHNGQRLVRCVCFIIIIIIKDIYIAQDR